MIRKLLCLSNGHGEDAIALAILQQLPRENLEISALPLVGNGTPYIEQNIPIIGPSQILPSGGFIYMDSRQLWQDVQQGLIQLTINQYRAIQQWVKFNQNNPLAILAVGDILPLGLAWLTGVNYAFVGTAKSNYQLNNQQGWLSQRSIYLPWERWLMSNKRCLGVYPRDSVTANNLSQYSIKVFDYGNPMMDLVDVSCNQSKISNILNILLLPGSRPKEAEGNWSQILESVKIINQTITKEPIIYLAAIAPTVDLNNLKQILINYGFQEITNPETMPIEDPKAISFFKQQSHLILTQQAYSQCLYQADLAIAMAGTATEQFVGLGKPAIAIPGKGPQYNKTFAKIQKRLLGPSLILVDKPEAVAKIVESLPPDSQRLAEIAKNGRERMGKPGAAKRIATSLMSNLF